MDVDGKPCNTGFTGQPGPHCAAAAQIPLPFLWSVRTGQQVKDVLGRPVDEDEQWQPDQIRSHGG